MRNRDLRRGVAFGLLALTGCWAGCGRRTTEVVVYFTNDIHGAVVERAGPGAARLAGLAGLAWLYAREDRAKLLVDSGDWFRGSIEGSWRGGQGVVDAMSAAGYDAAAPGNHEFALGPSHLARLARSAKFPILAANLREVRSGEPPAWARPWVIREVGGVRVGLFGLVTPELPRLVDARRLEGIAVADPILAARRAVSQLRGQGADIVVALSHLGWEPSSPRLTVGDQALARQVQGIDLIVGGHTHTTLTCDGGSPGPCVVQAGQQLEAVGRAVLTLERATHRPLRVRAELLPLLRDRVGLDPRVAEALEPLAREAERLGSVRVGRSEFTLTRSRWSESPLGDWVADCIREHTGAEAAVVNSGALRADLPAGPLTRADLFRVLPFDHELLTLSLKGADLATVLEHSLSGPQGLLQVSGLKMTAFPVTVDGRRLKEARLDGRRLDPRRDYRVATNEYLAHGGEGYPRLSEARVLARGGSPRAALESCASRRASLGYPDVGRIALQ